MGDMSLEQILFQISVWALPVLIAVTLHEAAHGFVAWRLGDDTAYQMGRVTFNPLRHIDPVGTVLMPAALLFFSGGRVMFGYAKPVPVDFGRLGRPRRDMVLVAAAGPGVNLLLAITKPARTDRCRAPRCCCPDGPRRGRFRISPTRSGSTCC